MSLQEKMRRQPKGMSRSRSTWHRYDGHKMSTVVNHVYYERLHGFESTKHKDRSEIDYLGTSAS